MRTVILLPPLPRMSGGAAMLLNVAAHLSEIGHETVFTSPGALGEDARARVAELPGSPPLILWQDLTLSAQDIYLVPEGWPNALSKGLDAGARTVVYAQSWNFLLTNLPQGVRWKQLPVEFLAVSRPVARFMEEVLDLNVLGILPPAAQDVFFQTGARPGRAVRVAHMPRKHRALTEQIEAVALALLERDKEAPTVSWVEIHNMTQAEVAAALASCHIFLASSFPEGFGLPPLEAMASGCVPVGFTGFGGWEYMRQARGGHTPPAMLTHAPHSRFTLDAAEPGNGFYLSDGDILGAGQALYEAVKLAHENGPAWQALQTAGQDKAKSYTLQHQKKAVERLWHVFSTKMRGTDER